MDAKDSVKKEETIFHAALQLPQEKRTAYLALACEGDEPLRARLEMLLEVQAKSDHFFQKEPLQIAAGEDKGTVLAAAPPEGPGAVIGRYKLRERIGEGGCGVVYVADQEEPVRRRVALKVIKLGMDTKSVVARFEAERQALAMMDHPNIAKVLDAGATETGRPYFVMELVRGIKITEYCDQNNLTTVQRLDLFVKVCQAVQHAHQKGIIHRDLKPSNILVTLHDGVPVPKVIDFGIAKATEGRLTDMTIYTELHQFIGTPAYMSPEQAEMSGLDIDTRSDIYSLGVLLYELLTGITPFNAADLLASGLDEMRRTIREKEPVRPSTRLNTMLQADLTTTAKHRQCEAPKLIHLLRGDLDWVVMKALEKDRTRRYETATGFAGDILRHLNNEPVVARPPSNIYRFQKMVRRNTLACGAVGAIAATILVGMGVSTWSFLKEREARKRAVAAERTADAALKNETTLRQQAETARKSEAALRQQSQDAATETKMTLAASDFAQAVRLIEEGNGTDALAYLAHSYSLNSTNDAVSTRLTTLLTYHSWMVPTVKLTNVSSASFSPDANRIVTASANGTARVWDAKSGKPLTEPLKHEAAVTAAQFSPDGTRIATASTDGTARVWDALSGLLLTGSWKHGGAEFSLQFSSDGKRILTHSGEAGVRVWDTQNGQLLGKYLKVNSFEGSSLSPDGTRAVTASMDKTARVWDVQTGQLLAGPLKHRQQVFSAQFSADGKRIVTASADDTARVWDALTGQPLTDPLKHGATVGWAEFSPDGMQIVTASDDQTARIWNALSGAPLTKPLKHGGGVSWAHFSPDGKRIVTASNDHAARVWDAQSGLPLTELLKHGSVVLSVQFSPDGKRILTVSSDLTASVWEIQGGRSLTENLKHPSQVWSARFSPDGSRIVAASQHGAAYVWDAKTGQMLAKPLEHGEDRAEVLAARFNPSGNRVVTASGDYTARVWDAQTGLAVTEPLRHTSNVVAAEFSPDGKRVVTASLDHTARAWDLQTGKPGTAPLKHQGSVRAAEFNLDGTRIVTASDDRTAQVWDAQSGQPLTEPLRHESAVSVAHFSPDGTRIVTASDNGAVRIWDAQTGQSILELLKHAYKVVSAQFSPDGKRILTASWDGTARVWDSQSGRPLTEPLKHASGVMAAKFSPDGMRIVTASFDGIARVWDAQTGQPLTEPLSTGSQTYWAEFSPDGKRIVTTSFLKNKAAQVWDIAPSPARRLDWLLELAEAISGEVLNKQGVLEPTTKDRSEVLKQVRHALGQTLPDDDWTTWGRWFLGDPLTRTISPFCMITVPEYIEICLKDPTLDSLGEIELLTEANSERQQRIIKARAKLEPIEKAFQLEMQARESARQGEWKEAAAMLRLALDFDPTDHWHWFELSPLLVELRDDPAYRQLCHEMLARFSLTNKSEINQRIATACLILPISSADLKAASTLADEAVVRGTNDIYYSYFEFTKALADYRQANFASAAEWAQKAVAADNSNRFLGALAQVVIAMARQGLQQPLEANSALAKASDIMETELPQLDSGELGKEWHEILIAHILLREAKELIGVNKRKPGQ